MFKLSSNEEDILTILGLRELYGLEILDGLNQDRPIPLSFGSIYPALNRLSKKGLVSWHWGEEQEDSGGARRKYYKVTGLGLSALNAVQQYRMLLVQRATQGQVTFKGV